LGLSTTPLGVPALVADRTDREREESTAAPLRVGSS
jgi:hypothetical protein